MSDSDFEIEDSVELLSLFSGEDGENGFSVLEIPDVDDWSDFTADLDFEDRHREYEQELPRTPGRENVLSQLEELAFSLIEQLQREALPVQLDLVKQTCNPSGYTMRKHVIKWPTKSGSIENFARLFRVIELIQEAIICDLPITKREIFYRDVALFRNQPIVNKLVEVIAHTLGVPRKSLNVRASAKGLFCGSGVEIGLKRGETIQGSDTEGFLIPPSEDIAWLKVSENVSWILIIEKEAIFQSLSKGSFASGVHLLGPGILITGKGYPDFATLEFTKQLSTIIHDSVPIGALMDGDPYGLEILSMYKYGGGTSNRVERFATSRIEWLGVWNSEIFSLGLKSGHHLLPLTRYDVNKCLKMLSQASRNMPSRWKQELSRMLFNHKKAEIEILLSDFTSIALQDQSIESATQPGLSFLFQYLAVKMKDLMVDYENILHYK